MKQSVTLFFLFSSIYINSQESLYTLDTIQIKSEILHESRSIIILKPQSTIRNDSAIFLYLLDGEYADYRFQKLLELYRDSIPDLIGVGIVNTDRRRDLLYANSADRFLEFITEELIPVAEKNYVTKARILFGHSFGGGFTVFALINKPDIFNSYIASSPTPIMDLVKQEYYLHVDSVSKGRIVFSFSMGSGDMGQVKKWALKLSDNLSTITFRNLDWHFTIFEGKDHNNSDVSALVNGLQDFRKHGFRIAGIMEEYSGKNDIH